MADNELRRLAPYETPGVSPEGARNFVSGAARRLVDAVPGAEYVGGLIHGDIPFHGGEAAQHVGELALSLAGPKGLPLAAVGAGAAAKRGAGIAARAVLGTEKAAARFAPLEGLPTKPINLGEAGTYVPGPHAPAHEAAHAYMKEAGLPYEPVRQYVPADPDRGRRIAQAYEEMQHAPDDPYVRAAYDALVRETMGQWGAIKKTGLNVDFIKPGQADPYAKTPRLVQQDVVNNNHMHVFPTEAGYGTEDATSRAGNPMLLPSGEVIGGHNALNNDIFRIVHDYFGHVKEGVGFRPAGEENAWRAHMAMYTPEARRAATAELRGQNSYLNYGPHAEHNKTASAADTIYAPQKVGLLPEWAVEEGRSDPAKYAPDPLAGIRGKYAGYAHEYPPVPEPIISDRATGKPLTGTPKQQQKALDQGTTYLAKGSTPTLDQFMKDRTAVVRDMETRGYAPYFDISKREHVDPSSYPTPHNMAEMAVPKKAETHAQYVAKYDTPEARANLRSGYEAGKGVEGADNWYAMKQLEDEYVRHLGPEEGRRRFQQEFAGSMAATTGGSSPTPNLLMSAYANHVNANKLPWPTNAYQMPNPIGGRYAGQNMKQARQYYESGEPFNANNPKRHDFQYSFLGHPDKATVDEQMMSAFGTGEQVPKWYGPATNVVIDEARNAGVHPRDFQDVGWAGLKKQKQGGGDFDYEGPMMEHINRAINRTSVLTGRSPEEVTRDWIVKRAPLYGVGGAVAGGAARYAPTDDTSQ